MKQITPTARSVAKKLSNLATELKVPYQYIFTSCLLERLVVRLTTHSELSSSLVFKGGYVNLRVYQSPRYTTDIDVLLLNGNLAHVVNLVKATAQMDIGDEIWFAFENSIDLLTQGKYPGIRLIFRAGIGKKLYDIKRAQIVHLDIGFGDAVRPIKAETQCLLGYGKLSWLVYPAETIAAEKLHCLFMRGSANSRTKDIYDLYCLLPKCIPDTLRVALRETFQVRGDSVPNNLAVALSQIDITLLKLGWKSAVGSLENPPSFEEAFAEIAGKISNLQSNL